MSTPTAADGKKGYTLRPTSLAELVEDYRRARHVVLRHGVGSSGLGTTREHWNALAIAALLLAERVSTKPGDLP